jgi:uncharacterized phage protein (TIGR01671 family)
MNREIKIKIWDNERNKWCDDFFTYGSLSNENNSFTLNNLEGDKTMVQYTGLKDKNGKEIYKGDIVKTWHNFSKFDYNKDKQEEFCTGIWVCVWETPRFMFNPNDERCIGRMTSMRDSLCEVIGNIYESPELLES